MTNIIFFYHLVIFSSILYGIYLILSLLKFTKLSDISYGIDFLYNSWYNYVSYPLNDFLPLILSFI